MGNGEVAALGRLLPIVPFPKRERSWLCRSPQGSDALQEK